ncbi:hypothetical protein B0G81_1818 [Paraburkholderia sp. BL6665CI2N2]|nr:hypothetical protein B0G81_1818 [Paraburkholderia sp. BL6665CI2N2]
MTAGLAVCVDGMVFAHEVPGEHAAVFGLPQRAHRASLRFLAQKRPGTAG